MRAESPRSDLFIANGVHVYHPYKTKNMSADVIVPMCNGVVAIPLDVTLLYRVLELRCPGASAEAVVNGKPILSLFDKRQGAS
jgi:hypothetical protein